MLRRLEVGLDLRQLLGQRLDEGLDRLLALLELVDLLGPGELQALLGDGEEGRAVPFQDLPREELEPALEVGLLVGRGRPLGHEGGLGGSPGGVGGMGVGQRCVALRPQGVALGGHRAERRLGRAERRLGRGAPAAGQQPAQGGACGETDDGQEEGCRVHEDMVAPGSDSSGATRGRTVAGCAGRPCLTSPL